jgi:PERQ amino acid-rich with GYF domain-containing protein
VNEFVDSILKFPTDPEILIDVVHGSSQTLDSRHFTEEFIRRRKLADKGISVESHGSMPALPSNAAAAIAAAGASGNSGGGWSEVAKKSPSIPSDNSLGSFKVVAPKKKGLKR